MPQKTISLPFARVSGTATHTQNMGTSADAVLFDQAILGTMWTAPFRVPVDCDVSRPIICAVELQAQTDNTLPGFNAVFRCDSTFWSRDGSPTDLDTETIFPIPNPWLFTDSSRLIFDNGNGWTYDAASFPADATIGIRLRRTPAHGSDNYLQPIRAAAFIALTYYQRCQKICC